MCNPVIVMASMAVASAGMQAAAQSSAANAAGRLAAANAQQAESAAADALQRGEASAAPVRQRATAIIAAQQAAEAAGNVDIQSGTPVQLAEDVAYVSGQDIQTIRNNAKREAWGLKAQGINFLNEGEVHSSAYGNAAVASIIGGAASAATIGIDGLQKAGYFDQRTTTPMTIKAPELM